MPYPDPKIVHFADKVNPKGGVSALCFKRPRSIDLTRATWSLTALPVTCPKCKKLLQQRSDA